MMHKTIKRFGMEGEVGDDADFARLREQYEAIVVRHMRDDGYVPVLGLGPFWSTEYSSEKENYRFELSVHGIHVGKVEAWTLEGMDVEGKLHRRPIRQNRPKQSSGPAESK